MKKKLLRTFMLAAALLVEGNAWAGDKTVLKYSFDDASSPSLTSANVTSFDYSRTSVITSTKFLNAYNNQNGDPGSTTISLGSTDLTEKEWTLEFEWAACGGCNSKPDHTTLKAGSTTLFDISGNSDWNTTVTLSYGASGSATIPVPGCDKAKRFTTAVGDQYNTTDYWHHFVITGSTEDGVKLTITNSNSGVKVVDGVTLSATNVSPTSIIIEACCGGGIGMDELHLYYYVEGEVIQTPTASYTNVNGAYRTVTAACETEGTTLYYSTDQSSWTEGSAYTTNVSGTVYFKAVKSESESDILAFPITAGEITLNSPVISRSGNTVTITSDQSDILLTPSATIYYTYGGGAPVAYSSAITVVADATITAYTTATGYANSDNTTRAVALFPSAGVTQVENAERVAYETNTLTDEAETVSGRNYAAMKYDGTRWGNKIKLQTTGWGLRGNNTWYVDGTGYLYLPDMKAGDIIVADIDKAASYMVNATYSEKYTYGNRYAYIVTADGGVELGFTRISSQANSYVRGFYAWTYNVTGTQVGALDNSTADRAATSTKVTLKPGESYHYSFKNYNSGGGSEWNNFVLLAYNSSDVEQIAVRADNFEIHDWRNNGCSNNFNGTNFVSKMNGATVDMTVNYSATNVFTMNATIITNEATPSTWNYSYTSDYSGSGISLSGNIKVALSVDHAWLDITEEGMTAVSATIGKNGYTTFASSYPLDLTTENLPAGVKAYKAAVYETTVRFTELNQCVPANTGILLAGTADANVNIAVAASGTTVEGNEFFVNTTGSTFDADDGYTYYGMKKATKAEESIVFAKFTPSSVAIPADKAYLKVSNSGNARLNVVFDDAAGISTVETVKAKNDATYNLRGQRVAQPQKGLYIVNGKKVIIK